MNIFNEKEFENLRQKFGGKAFCKDVTIKYKNKSFYERMKKTIETDRRGEVVFCVIRPNGKIITVTCDSYPEGIYRIPTGGLKYNEDVVKGVYREVREELGLSVEITDFAGVLRIKFEHENDSCMFYSYMFVLKETGGRLLEDAEDDEISAVKEVDIKGLEDVANGLKTITESWSDWGNFRYQTTSEIDNFLKQKMLTE